MFQARYVIPVVVVVLLLLIIFGGSQNTEQETSASEPARPGALPVQPVRTVPTETTEQPDATIPPPKVAGAVPIERRLADKVESFARAYYLILPNDTLSSRKRRMRGLVPRQRINDLELEVRQSTPLTTRGELDTKGLRAARLNDNKRFLEVTIPLTLVYTAPDGKEVHREATVDVSRWKFAKGEWVFAGVGIAR